MRLKRVLGIAGLLGVMAGSAQAICPTGQLSFNSVDGKFKICPAELDVDGDPVGAGFYKQCDVTVTWGGSKTASFTLNAPVAGVPVVVSFPAAKGAGGATGTCTNVDNVTGAVAAASITFPRGKPAKPVLSE